MDLANFRNWIAVSMIGLITAIGWNFTKSWKVGDDTARPRAIDVSYQMPRPQAFSKALDLSQRDIDRQVQFPEATQRVVNKVAPMAQNLNKVMAQNKPNLTNSKNKKTEAKKTADQKRKKLTIVSSGGQKHGRTPHAADLAPDVDNRAIPYSVQPVAPAKAETTPIEKPRLTAAQWKSLILNDPSPKNVADFLSAFRKGEVVSAQYYQVVKELLVTSNQDIQSVALILLNSDISLAAFEILVTQQAQVSDETRLAMESMVQSYSRTNHFSALSRALLSPVPEVASQATQLLEVALSLAVSEENPRDARGLASGATPLSFQVFIPALRRIVDSPENPLLSDAQALLERIQTMLQNMG